MICMREVTAHSEKFLSDDREEVRIFEKVKKCCSLDSHPNRNRNYETSQTDSDSYPGQCTILPSAVWWRCLGAEEE